jgi:hypothetical protein
MVVQVSWPGATAIDTLKQVTDRIEKKLEETPNLDYLKSYTKPGQATVFVYLKESTPKSEIQDIWYQVRKKVSDIKATLPKDVSGPSTTNLAMFSASSTASPAAASRRGGARRRDRAPSSARPTRGRIFGDKDEDLSQPLPQTRQPKVNLDDAHGDRTECRGALRHQHAVRTCSSMSPAS